MLTFSKAFTGFVYSRQADGISPHTETAYRWGILPLIKYLGDPCIDKITGEQLKEYFHYLREETELAEPSLAQVWRVIKAFFTWAEKDLHFVDNHSLHPPAFTWSSLTAAAAITILTPGFDFAASRIKNRIASDGDRSNC